MSITRRKFFGGLVTLVAIGLIPSAVASGESIVVAYSLCSIAFNRRLEDDYYL